MPGSTSESPDDELRARLRANWTTEGADAVVRLGPAALERLLDAPDSAFWPTETEWRDFSSNRQQAVAAFARKDMGVVLAAIEARRWTGERVALSGVGLVPEARVVPYLVAAYGEAAPSTRSTAIHALGFQRDPRATATVVRALRDRSSDVRLQAVESLGRIADRATIDALRAVAANPRSTLLAGEAKRAIRKIRAATKGRGA